jgi:signal-transduction protein with cAMP-binding, CBS, and nucleotidyltransferase domain
LQNKNTHFIIDYLPKLQPIIVKKGTKIITKETFPTDVFFIYKGSVKNTNNDKIFNDGAVIGETDIIYNREIRIESFIAIKETYLLRLERPVFESL